MTSIRIAILIVLVSGAVVGCAEEKIDSDGAFLGEAYPPVTTEEGEGWISVNGDGDRMVFGRHRSEGWTNHVLLETVRTSSGWSDPQVLPFSGAFNDRGARFYPALDALLFSSDRPLDGAGEASDFNLWVAIHDGEEWIDPEPLDALNSDENDFHGSVSATGTIYFSSSREGGRGGSDIYRAVLRATGYELEPLVGAVNTEYSEADVFVDPEETYIIFSRTDDPNGFGGDDLWISFLEGYEWDAPQNLGDVVNSSEHEYGSYVSRDGRTLYFTSHQDGDADIMTIPMSLLNIVWPGR